MTKPFCRTTAKEKSRRTADKLIRPFKAAALIFRAAVPNGQKARTARATKKFEEPDTRRQTISKAIAELLYIMLNS